MSLKNQDKKDLFNPVMVLRHGERLGVWLKLLNMEKNNLITQCFARSEFRPKSNDTDFWIDLLKDCGEYIGFNNGHITFTDKGHEFLKSMRDLINKKFPLVVTGIESCPRSVEEKQSYSSHLHHSNHLKVNMTIGDKQVNIAISSTLETYYYDQTTREVLGLYIANVDGSGKLEYESWYGMNQLKPILMQALNGDEFIDQIKKFITPKIKGDLGAFALEGLNVWRQLL